MHKALDQCKTRPTLCKILEYIKTQTEGNIAEFRECEYVRLVAYAREGAGLPESVYDIIELHKKRILTPGHKISTKGMKCIRDFYRRNNSDGKIWEVALMPVKRNG